MDMWSLIRRKAFLEKKYTIRDIAKLANVSHMTVSRVLNNDPQVRETTRTKVNEVISEFNYQPHALSPAFATKRSRILALVVSDISNPFYAELSRGIEDKAFDMGYSVIFCSSDEQARRTEACVNHMLRTGVDGFISPQCTSRSQWWKGSLPRAFRWSWLTESSRAPTSTMLSVTTFRGPTT